MALSLKWFTGRETKEEKENLENLIRNSTTLLSKVEEIILSSIEEAEVTKLVDYDKPSWPYYRADRDGQIRALTALLTHLTAR